MKESWCKLLSLLLFAVVMLLAGCRENSGDMGQVKDLDYTVVQEADLPMELRTAIEEKKETGFKMTYEEGDYLYIVVGYGPQDSGGYSIVVNELQLTEKAILFDTELFGPKTGEVVEETPTYPFITVKIEYMDKNVIFD